MSCQPDHRCVICYDSEQKDLYRYCTCADGFYHSTCLQKWIAAEQQISGTDVLSRIETEQNYTNWMDMHTLDVANIYIFRPKDTGYRFPCQSTTSQHDPKCCCCRRNLRTSCATQLFEDKLEQQNGLHMLLFFFSDLLFVLCAHWALRLCLNMHISLVFLYMMSRFMFRKCWWRQAPESHDVRDLQPRLSHTQMFSLLPIWAVDWIVPSSAACFRNIANTRRNRQIWFQRITTHESSTRYNTAEFCSDYIFSCDAIIALTAILFQLIGLVSCASTFCFYLQVFCQSIRFLQWILYESIRRETTNNRCQKRLFDNALAQTKFPQPINN